MNLSEAIEKITKNYEELPKKTIEKIEAVWIYQSDTAGSCEVDEENIGIKHDGSIVWAYASGCSCWDGDYDTCETKDIKTLTLQHE